MPSDTDINDLIAFGTRVRNQSDNATRLSRPETSNPQVLAAGEIYAANQHRQGFKPLFNSSLLNFCQFEKTVARDSQQDHVTPGQVRTKMIFPFNNPDSQGQMQYAYMFLFERDFDHKVKSAFNASMAAEDREHDLKALSYIDELPSFDAFLLKDKFDVEGIELDESYATVSDAQYNAIKKPIMMEFYTIIDSTIGDGEGIDKTAAAERLLNALWNLDDIDTLKPLVLALRIEESEASRHFFAWKGLLYYVHMYGNRFNQFTTVVDDLREMAQIQDIADAHSVEDSLQKIIDIHNKFTSFKRNYHALFDAAFKSGEDLGGFMKILISAGNLYWMLGYAIGMLVTTEDFVRSLKDSVAPDNQKAREVRSYLQNIAA